MFAGLLHSFFGCSLQDSYYSNGIRKIPSFGNARKPFLKIGKWTLDSECKFCGKIYSCDVDKEGKVKNCQTSK